MDNKFVALHLLSLRLRTSGGEWRPSRARGGPTLKSTMDARPPSFYYAELTERVEVQVARLPQLPKTRSRRHSVCTRCQTVFRSGAKWSGCHPSQPPSFRLTKRPFHPYPNSLHGRDVVTFISSAFQVRTCPRHPRLVRQGDDSHR